MNHSGPTQTKPDDAAMLFASGFNCAQAVFGAYAESVRVEKDVALRVATGFGAGMGRRQEVCGALTSAIMMIGCRNGMTDPKDVGTKEKAYAEVRRVSAEFERMHGSIHCRELLGCDLSTEEGKQAFKAGDMAKTRCARFVHDAALLVAPVPDR